jgi:hypothetical protein
VRGILLAIVMGCALPSLSLPGHGSIVDAVENLPTLAAVMMHVDKMQASSQTERIEELVAHWGGPSPNINVAALTVLEQCQFLGDLDQHGRELTARPQNDWLQIVEALVRRAEQYKCLPASAYAFSRWKTSRNSGFWNWEQEYLILEYGRNMFEMRNSLSTINKMAYLVELSGMFGKIEFVRGLDRNNADERWLEARKWMMANATYFVFDPNVDHYVIDLHARDTETPVTPASQDHTVSASLDVIVRSCCSHATAVEAR